jgi:PPOX class probable F420-dependent enzyme
LSLLSASAKELITSGALAHAVTLNRDGSPQVSLVWADVAGDGVVFFARNDRVKMRNLRQDPRLVISFEDARKAANGLTQYLGLYGRVSLFPGQDINELTDRLSQRYMGRDRFPFPRENQTLVQVAVGGLEAMVRGSRLAEKGLAFVRILEAQQMLSKGSGK